MRALVLQLCMMRPPGELRIIGPLRGENAWAERLPHRRASTGVPLALGGAGEPAPERTSRSCAPLLRSQPPPRCAVVLTVRSPGEATVDIAGEVREVSVEAVGLRQAEGLAAELAERAVRVRALQTRQYPSPSIAAGRRAESRSAAACPRSSASRRAIRLWSTSSPTGRTLWWPG